MEDSKKIFIRGSDDHGDKVIKYLEELGENYSHFDGKSTGCIYFINHDNLIECYTAMFEAAKVIIDCYKEVTIDEVLAYFAEKDRWDYDGNHIVKGYHIASDSHIDCKELSANDWSRNVFATEKQAKSALAMAQISQYMANDKRYGGVVTDEEWYCDRCIDKYVIMRRDNELSRGIRNGEYHFLAFHTAEQRELFIKEHEDLVKDYLMID